MIGPGLIEAPRLGELLAAIEPELFRYPAVDRVSLRAAVQRLGSRSP